MSALAHNGASFGTGWRPRAKSLATPAAFFVAFYLYVWLVIEPHLIFHGAGIVTNFPAFYTTRPFLAAHLAYPGGPTEYLSAFLSQWFYDSALGALAITAQALMFWLAVMWLVRVSGLKRLSPVAYVPSLLLLILYGRYTYYVPTLTALLVALGLACLYVTLVPRRPLWIGPVVFGVLLVAGYYVAAGAVLLFVAVCIVFELFSKRRWTLSLAYTAAGAVLPYLFGVYVFDVNVADAYSRLLPLSWKLLDYDTRNGSVELVYALYLLVPVALAAGELPRILWTRFHREQGGQRRRKKEARSKGIIRRIGVPKLRWLMQTAVLLAIAAAVAFGSLDRETKAEFALDYCVHQRRWPEVIATGTTHLGGPAIMHAVDRALYHTGRLGNEMFHWPQQPEYLLLSGTEGKRVFWQTIDLYLEIGFINGAEHALTECLEGLGERPTILQRLALVNLVKGNLGTARVYLSALSHTLSHRNWARGYLALLQRDPTLCTDEQVQRLRSLALDTDFTTVTMSPEKLLTCLLEKNDKNRMAFEYLMAWYLTTKQLVKFTECLDRFEPLGYTALPTHFEEAALVYVYGQRKPLRLGGYQPRAEVRQRVEHFTAIMSRYQGNEQAALAELMKSHARDYFFYFVYAQPNRGS